MIPMPEAPNAVAGVRDQELTVRDLARRVGARALGQWLIPFAVALLTFVVLSPALRNGFVEWDDHINLTNNEDYRGLGSAQLKYFFTTTLMGQDRKSTRLNSSHRTISYAVFCLKKKKNSTASH